MMHCRRYHFFAVMLACAQAHGSSDYPSDVTEFIERRELCDHFRGELPYDEERAEFLSRQIKETCFGTDSTLKTLKDKYRDNKTIMNMLNRFEENIEPS